MTAAVRFVTDAALRERGLHQPDGDADKEGRGTVLVVGGSREVPGAAVLAAVAALRAGAGRMVIATSASTALAVGLAVPEARVIGLPETDAGGFAPEGLALLEPLIQRVDAVVVGPGLMDEAAATAFAAGVLDRFSCPVVLDAHAMNAVPRGARARGPVLLTPHAGEMAHLTGVAKDVILAAAAQHARRAAEAWGVGVALKGATTCIAFPGEPDWQHDGGDVGLATSGSGDTLAGLAGGLAARGAPIVDVALWAVRLHALAGERLARRHGRLGYLARELGDEVPAAMHALCTDPEEGQRPDVSRSGSEPGSASTSAPSSA